MIGRGSDVKLTLPHPLVSRRHCELFEREGQLVVRDLGSLNGTFVDSKRIDEDEALEPGRLLTIGTVTFRAVYEANQSQESHEGSDRAAKRDTVVEAESLRDTQRSGNDEVAKPSVVLEPETDSALSISDTPSAALDVDASDISLDDVTIDLGEAKKPNVEALPGDIFEEQPDDSVSLSALEGLPQPPSQLSFVGGVSGGNDSHGDLGEVSFPGIEENDGPTPKKSRRKAK